MALLYQISVPLFFSFQCALKGWLGARVASYGGLIDVISHEYLPPESPLGLITNVGSKKIKVAVGDGVNEAVTVGDGVRVGVGVGGIKIAVWLAAMAAVCAMITSSSPAPVWGPEHCRMAKTKARKLMSR